MPPMPAELPPPYGLHPAGFLLLTVGAFAAGAAVEAQPGHWVLFLVGGLLLFIGHLSATTEFVRGSRDGNATLPSLAVVVSVLAITTGWAQARYGLADVRGYATVALSIVALVAFPFVANLKVSPTPGKVRKAIARLQRATGLDGSAASELVLLVVVFWAVARGVTSALRNESSWESFTFAAGLVCAVLAVPAMQQLAAARSRRVDRSRDEGTHDRARAPRLESRVEGVLTFLTRIVAGVLAGGAGVVLWREYQHGDGIVPVMVFAGGALVLAFVGHRFTKLVVKGGDVEVDLDVGGAGAAGGGAPDPAAQNLLALMGGVPAAPSVEPVVHVRIKAPADKLDEVLEKIRPMVR